MKEFGCRANGEANKTVREESSAMKENVILPAPQTPTRTKACTYTSQNIHLCVCMCVYPGILPAHVGPRDSGIPTCGQTNGLIKSLTPRAAREKQHAEWRASTMCGQAGRGGPACPGLVSYLDACIPHVRIFCKARRNIYICICILRADVEYEIFHVPIVSSLR